MGDILRARRKGTSRRGLLHLHPRRYRRARADSASCGIAGAEPDTFPGPVDAESGDAFVVVDEPADGAAFAPFGVFGEPEYRRAVFAGAGISSGTFRGRFVVRAGRGRSKSMGYGCVAFGGVAGWCWIESLPSARVCAGTDVESIPIAGVCSGTRICARTDVESVPVARVRPGPRIYSSGPCARLRAIALRIVPRYS